MIYAILILIILYLGVRLWATECAVEIANEKLDELLKLLEGEEDDE